MAIPPDIPSFATTVESVIMEVSLALRAQKNEEYYASGSAVLIANNVAITAKHVFEDFWKLYSDNKKLIAGPEASGNFSMQAISFPNDGKKAALWNILYVALAPNTDIAFLHLTPADENSLNYKWKKIPKIDFAPPKVGEEISCFGYRESKTSFENKKIIWEQTPTTSRGVVKEVHGEFRDNSRMKFPCFQTNARFDGGMSGGPIFNSKGKLCGIICSSLEPSNQEEEHVSYGTTLWPAMITKLEIDRIGYPNGQQYRALELAEKGFIQSDNWERIKIVADDVNKTQTISFRN